MSQESAQTPSFKMTAPTGAGKKRDDVELLPVGPNPGILYSIVDLGSHHNDRFNKTNRLIRLTFEFPLFQQLFKVDDTEKKPTVVSVEYSFIMAEKSKLKQFCDGALGRILMPQEYAQGYDIGQFLGRPMIVNIIHVPSKKDPNVSYARISTVQGITEQVRAMYNIDWNLIKRYNDISAFMIDEPQFKSFQSEAFANLPGWLRDKIMSSVEAKAYASGGGQFIAKAEYTPNNASPFPADAKPPVQRVPQANVNEALINGRRLKVLINFTYEVLVSKGWTAETLVSAGHAEWVKEEAPAPQPPVLDNTPLPPSPQQPQVPQQGQALEQDGDNDVPF